MGCERVGVATKYAGWGALFRIAVYSNFALIASWFECIFFQYSLIIAFNTMLVGILFGALIGGIVGGITGMAEYEKDTYLYKQGVRMGNRVLILQTGSWEMSSPSRHLYTKWAVLV